MTSTHTADLRTADAAGLRALRESQPLPFWLDSARRRRRSRRWPAPTPATSPWSAPASAVSGRRWPAKEQDPATDVVVLEAGRVAGQATGRNGGICMASLTHGLSQGAELFPRENVRLAELGLENLGAIERTVSDLGIGCGWERTGELEIASFQWQLEGLRAVREEHERDGIPHTWLDGEELRAEIRSPTYLGGLWHHDSAILDPARLAWGLARACRERGVRFYERTPVAGLARGPAGWNCARRGARCARVAPCSPPTLSRRCSSGCASTSSPSTTTR